MWLPSCVVWGVREASCCRTAAVFTDFAIIKVDMDFVIMHFMFGALLFSESSDGDARDD